MHRNVVGKRQRGNVPTECVQNSRVLMTANVRTEFIAPWICLAPEDNAIASIISSITNYGFGAAANNERTRIHILIMDASNREHDTNPLMYRHNTTQNTIHIVWKRNCIHL